MEHTILDPPLNSLRPGLRSKHPLLDISPGRLLVLTILTILLAEIGERLILAGVPPASDLAQIFIDMISMLVVLTPVYFLIYRPLQAEWHQRQQREEALLKSEERLKYALEAINDGVWDWIVPTNEVYFSPRWQTMLGYEPGELEANYRTWEGRLHPEDKEKTVGALMAHVQGKTPHYESEHRLRTKDGHYIWIHDRGRVVERDAQGRSLRATGTHTDITRRKLAEEEIHRLWRQLDRAVTKERGRLARDLHDHLGQLVTVLQLELGLVKCSLREPEQLAGCARITDLVTQLGTEIRNVASRLRPPALDMGLLPALKSDLGSLREHLVNPKIRLHAQEMELQRFDAEIETTLFRIYQEALNNAVKHAHARTIDIRLQRQEDGVLLAVEDDGVGFDPQQRPSSTTGQVGIGLASMRERISAHGGHLDITSTPGLGTTISAFLPLGPGPSGESS